MRTKSLYEPTGIEKGHYWLSPDGVSPPWNRVWNGTAWRDFEEDEPEEEEELEEDDGTEDEDPPTEETNDEQRDEAEVSDRDGAEQGSGGKPEPKP